MANYLKTTVGLLMVLIVCSAIDIYVVRHGARSPTKLNTKELFGVDAGELTA
jgi:hypothetical protein